MFDDEMIGLDCATCVAANTTACGECVVTHVLANDAGPIELVVVAGSDEVATPGAAADADPVDRAIGLFAKAGLVDDRPCFVDPAAFDEAVTGRHPAAVAR